MKKEVPPAKDHGAGQRKGGKYAGTCFAQFTENAAKIIKPPAWGWSFWGQCVWRAVGAWPVIAV